MSAQHRRVRRASRRASKARLVALAGPPGQRDDAESLRAAVRRHPWTALGIAAGVGVMMGLSPQLRNGVISGLISLGK